MQKCINHLVQSDWVWWDDVAGWRRQLGAALRGIAGVTIAAVGDSICLNGDSTAVNDAVGRLTRVMAPHGNTHRGEPTLRSMTGLPFLSDRGAQLFCDGVADSPVLTVEDYMKWYGLWVIWPSCAVTPYEFPEGLEHEFITKTGESAYGNHVFNPKFVYYAAELDGLEVCSSAMEAIIGRWNIEHLGVLDDWRRHDEILLRGVARLH